MDLLAELREVCGAANVRLATAADISGGVRAGYVAVPQSPVQLAALVRVAAGHRLAVVPAGAGTKPTWGGPPSTVDLLVDTVRLAGCVRHDSTVVAGAGARLRDLDPVLRPAGHRLALDPPSMPAGATVGGVLAAAETGPLRQLSGPIGNLVDAIEYVDAAGVLRQVTGLEAAAMCGSLGTLGVIVGATVRLHPRPAATAWLRRTVHTPSELYDLVQLMGAMPFGVVAVEADWPSADPVLARVPRPRPAGDAGAAVAAGRPPGPGALAVQVEGTERGVRELVSTATTLLGGDTGVLPRPPVWWGRLPGEPGATLLRLGGPPAALHAVGYTLRDATSGTAWLRGSVGAGLVIAALPGDLPAERVVSIVESTRYTMTGREGWCSLLHGPAAVHAALAGSDPDAAEALARKEAADPDDRFTPGRLPLPPRR